MDYVILDNIHDEYKQLIILHREVKELVITCEKIDPKQRANIAAIAELRSVLDHILRAHEIIYDIKSINQIKCDTGYDANDYCKSNINKAFAHLYRAGYDAYDVISIVLIEKIENLLKKRSTEALFLSIPDFNIIFPNIAEAQKKLTKVKTEKDIENHINEDSVEISQEKLDLSKRFYKTCEEATNELQDFYDLLIKYMPNVIKYEKEKKNSVILSIIIGVVIAAVFYIFGLINQPN